MTDQTRSVDTVLGAAFRHEAMLYAGLDEFVAGAAAFLREGLEKQERALVVVDQYKIDALRDVLGQPEDIVFADMRAVGVNPARIIPVWREWVADAQGGPVRGIGEPIWPDRRPDELEEAVIHESLLNHAFADSPAWRLVCPYDVGALDPAVLEYAHHTHPSVLHGPNEKPSELFDGSVSFGPPLRPAPDSASTVRFTATGLNGIRRLVQEMANVYGLGTDAADDLVVAVGEIAANSIRHGGGGGLLSVWESSDALVCEITDRGSIASPLVGRTRPTTDQESGIGLWLVNQLCDLVQVRSNGDGSVIRLHMRRR